MADEPGRRWEGVDDRTVAGRAADGDPEAFAALVTRYTPLLRAYVRRLLGASDEVDDIVQETLVAAWLKLPSLADLGAVRSWLIRIASRKTFDRLRRRHPSVDLAAQEPPEADHREPTRVVEARSQLQALSAALSELPEVQRRCWVLREIAEYSYDEIADELAVPVSTVRGLLARARKSLVVQMEDWR
ncbi:MAG TPA: RNA polymerase sigma factor [Cellulomonas sp.]